VEVEVRVGYDMVVARVELKFDHKLTIPNTLLAPNLVTPNF